MKNIFLTLLIGIIFTQQSCVSQHNNETYKATPQSELKGLATAYFASGCFWCVEAVFESVKGVKESVSGYAGGNSANPTYQQVGSGQTGHAEVVKIYYDPKIVNFETLVTVFYDSQDPTTVGQNPDFGKQYRSIIFYENAEEKSIAEKAKKDLEKSGEFSKPIVTEITELKKFWKAEEYHQDYEIRNPDNRYIMGVSIPRLNRFKAKHPELLK